MSSIDVRGTGGASGIDSLGAVVAADPRMPTGALAETASRVGPGWGAAAVFTTTGKLYLAPVILKAGSTVTSISWWSGTTAAVTPTAWWFALYNSASTLMAQTADQTSTAWAGQTLKTVNLTTPQSITSSGLYYLGFSMTAATMVTAVGVGPTNTHLSTAPILFGPTSDSALGGVAPATAGAISPSYLNYGYCS